MTNKEQIRAEIERLKKESQDAYRPQDDNNFLFGKVTACEEMLELIDSMQEESFPDLEAEIARYEDEIHGYESTSYDGCVEIARHFAAWQKEQDERKCKGCFDRDEVFRQGMLKGAKEKEEQQ